MSAPKSCDSHTKYTTASAHPGPHPSAAPPACPGPQVRSSDSLRIHRPAAVVCIHSAGCSFVPTANSGQEGSPQKPLPSLSHLGDLVLLTPHPADGAGPGRIRSGAGQGQPEAGWGWAGAAGAEWLCQAPPASTREAAILLHCAASRRGHREPSILPKTHIPTQRTPIESIFLLG